MAAISTFAYSLVQGTKCVIEIVKVQPKTIE